MNTGGINAFNNIEKEEIVMQNVEVVPQQVIESKIFIIRGKRVMLDKDLAVLYGVETKMLNRAVKGI